MTEVTLGPLDGDSSVSVAVIVTAASGSPVALSRTTPAIAPVVSDCAWARPAIRRTIRSAAVRISTSLEEPVRARHHATINSRHMLRATRAKLSQATACTP